VKFEWDSAKREAWLDEFKKAAALFHCGQYLSVRAIEIAGSNACTTLILELDTESTIGREILIPLLKDGNPYIQVSAARYLITRYPALTIPLLKHLEENDVTGADFSAQNILWVYEHGGADL